jgi:hypothetical protein
MSKLTKKQQWFKQIILTKKDKVDMGPDVRHFAFNFPFFLLLCIMFSATAKSPKNASRTTSTLQNRVGKVLLTLASIMLMCEHCIFF